MDTKYLSDICLTITFKNDIQQIVREEFEQEKNGDYFGEWEFKNHIYLYEINLKENELYLKNGHHENMCNICDGYLCMFKELDEIFKGIKYTIKYH